MTDERKVPTLLYPRWMEIVGYVVLTVVVVLVLGGDIFLEVALSAVH
jgi:hypothetical protein